MIEYLLVFLIFSYSAYTDIKTKEVSNKIILLGLILALIINPTNFLINLIIGIMVFYSLWKLGGFGAGDSKLFIIYTLFFGITQTLILFIITGIIFTFYNFLLKKQEKRLVPFILTAFILKIIIYILVML